MNKNAILNEPVPAADVIGEDVLTGRDCEKCNNPISIPRIFTHLVKNATICMSCRDAMNREESIKEARESQERAFHKRLYEWGGIFPFKQDTDPSKLPRPTLLEKALKFNFAHGRGLLFHGISGTGKSRIAWEVLRREFMSGKKVQAIDSGFGYHYASKFSKSPEWVEEWMEEMIGCDILFCDDVFKCKITDSIDQAIFYLTDKRYEKGRPIFWTLNDTAESLIARLGSDRGPALLRRIRETCDTIAFT